MRHLAEHAQLCRPVIGNVRAKEQPPSRLLLTLQSVQPTRVTRERIVDNVHMRQQLEELAYLAACAAQELAARQH